MDIIKRVIKTVLVVAILAIVVNDAWRYVAATYQLGNVTREAAARSVAEVKPSGGDRTRVWQAGETYAEQHGAVVYGFDMKDQNVHVWTRMPVKGTIVLQRVMALIDGKPQTTALLVDGESSIVVPVD